MSFHPNNLYFDVTMADFCKQCLLEEFGFDAGDLAGITTPEEAADNRFAVVLCESCGAIQVAPDGTCVSFDCDKDGHETSTPIGEVEIGGGL